MIIWLEISFGTACIILASVTIFYGDYDTLTKKQLHGYYNLTHFLSYSVQFLGTGIYLTILLQVFNWFPGRLIHQIMALWVMTQSLGYITWILIVHCNNWIKLLVVGPIFLLLALFDYFYFRMYPAQENIFVEDAYCQPREKEVFDKMNVECKLLESVALRRSKRLSVFDLQASFIDSHRPLKVTFAMPFADTKIY